MSKTETRRWVAMEDDGPPFQIWPRTGKSLDELELRILAWDYHPDRLFLIAVIRAYRELVRAPWWEQRHITKRLRQAEKREARHE